MGMAAPQKYVPYPLITEAQKKAGLIQCGGCDAILNPEVQWGYFSYPAGDTSGRDRLVSTIPTGKCPMCSTPYPTKGADR